MKKIVIIINGNGGVGKDTLCDFAAEKYKVTNVSAITIPADAHVIALVVGSSSI